MESIFNRYVSKFGIYMVFVESFCSFSSQSNFHIFYYFYDGLMAKNELSDYHLDTHRSYNYLRIEETDQKTNPRYDTEENVKKFEDLQAVFQIFDFSQEQIETIYSILSAILILGEIKFKGASEQDSAHIENEDDPEKIAKLLKVDEKKFCWSLVNYCLVKKDMILKKVHNCIEAKSARDVLANNLYSRLVDYIISVINHKLSIGRTIL